MTWERVADVRIRKVLSKPQRKALEVLLQGDAYVEGGPTTLEHGRIVNVTAARKMEDLGLIETFEDPTRSHVIWKARITDLGRRAIEPSPPPTLLEAARAFLDGFEVPWIDAGEDLLEDLGRAVEAEEARLNPG